MITHDEQVFLTIFLSIILCGAISAVVGVIVIDVRHFLSKKKQTKVGYVKQEFEDLRGRKWEMFTDYSYFDMICVRISEDKDFNSETSFHFARQDDANIFANLIKKSK